MTNAHLTRLVATSLFCYSLAGSASAQTDLSFSGQFDFGLRHYTSDGLFAGQSDAGTYAFVGTQIDASAPLGPGNVVLQFSALLDDDNGRSFVNLKKGYYTQANGSFDFLAGWNVENWGVAESRSIMNVLNPRVTTDVIGGGDFIGTPMINGNFTSQFGTFSAYALFGFEQPELSDRHSRHRAPFRTDADRARFQGDKDDVDIALRFANNYSFGGGSLDFAAHYFNGTSRTAKSLPGCVRSFGPITEAVCNGINHGIVQIFEAGIPGGRDPQDFFDLLDEFATDDLLQLISAIPVVGFIPYYQKTQQVGTSLVYARKDLQLRFEGTYTKPRNEDGYVSAVIGGDYQFNNLGATGGSLNVALEYLHDDRNSRQPLTIFENDVFLGANYRFNNPQDTRIQLGGFYDLDSHAQLYQLQVSTRVTDAVSVEFNAVHIEVNGWNDPLAFAKDDSFFEVKFSAFF